MIDHLLVHCEKARMLWQLMLAIVGLVGFFPSQFVSPFFHGQAPLWARNVKRPEWQPSSEFYGLFGAKETCFLLRMRRSQFTG